MNKYLLTFLVMAVPVVCSIIAVHTTQQKIERACLYDNAVTLSDREFVCVLKRPIQSAPKAQKQSGPKVSA